MGNDGPLPVWSKAVEDALRSSKGYTIDTLGPCVHMLRVDASCIYIIAMNLLQYNIVDTFTTMRARFVENIVNMNYWILTKNEDQLFCATTPGTTFSQVIEGDFVRAGSPPSEFLATSSADFCSRTVTPA